MALQSSTFNHSLFNLPSIQPVFLLFAYAQIYPLLEGKKLLTILDEGNKHVRVGWWWWWW